MAKKKKDIDDAMAEVKKRSLQSLEETDYAAFVRELARKDIFVKDWEAFKKEFAAEMRKVRGETMPLLSIQKLAAKTGLSRVNLYGYEDGTRRPNLFNLWLYSQVCGKKLKITIE